MNHRKLRLSLILASIVLLLTAATALAAHHTPQNFRAHLSGDQEVPPVDTQAQGQAIISFRGGELHYKLIVANIDDVVAAHIHCAPEGENGPVGVPLFGGGPTSDSGILAEASVDAPPEGNSCGWEDLGDVQDAIANGGAYVNVHTIANPPGEIRGQIH